jgi:hypothetical protein
MLLAVPSVVVDGHVLQGPKLLAWFNEVTSTYLEPAYWTSSYSFSATKSLFSDAPELLATWRQTTQSDTKVRKKAKAPQHLLQHGDKTVAKIATAHLEDVQAAKVLGLWDPFATFLHDLEHDAKHCDGYRVSLLGLDLTSRDDAATHHHVLELVRKYLDRQRALELTLLRKGLAMGVLGCRTDSEPGARSPARRYRGVYEMDGAGR